MNAGNLAICLFLGAVSGLVAALCGVGGGIIMVPVLTLALGLGHKTAVATSLAIIVPTAIAATAQNVRGGLVDWKVLVPVAIGASLAAYFGAAWMKSLSNDTLTRVFAVLLIAVGVRMLLVKGGG